MKWKQPFLFAVLVFITCSGSGLHAQTPQATTATTTLLPSDSKYTNDPNGFLIQENSAGVPLEFDLRGLPAGLKDGDFIRCTLRLANKENSGAPNVIVSGRLSDAPGSPSIVSLSVVRSTQPIALQANENLRKAVYEKYTSTGIFSIILYTDTRRASSLFHSKSSVAGQFSKIPRLVIEYKLPPPSLFESLGWPQPQHDPRHTGRSEWVPFTAPAGFVMENVSLPVIGGGPGTLVDYPLVYAGDLYVIYKTGNRNFLACLDFTGKNKLWEKDIGAGTIQRSPAISPMGLIYAVTEDRIAAYDLKKAGEPVASYSLTGKLTPYTDVTIGNDGSVFLALNQDGVNYILGFTSKLAPFLRSGSFDKRTSTVTATASGTRVFAETSKGAAVIDIPNPILKPALPLQGWEYYHDPVAGPDGGVMVFADFTSTANKGNVWSYSSAPLWNLQSTLTPQPVLGSNGLVYFIQDGKLQGVEYNGRGHAKVASGQNLNSTSNLVMDGANNIFFWNNGAVQGFRADGTPLFAPQQAATSVPGREGEGPEKFLRLLPAPDGTIWVNNRNGNSLFAFKPIYAQASLTIRPEDIKSRTVYRTTGTLTVAPNVSIGAGQVLFQAQKGISFSSGFRIEKGASLLCRTGF